MEKDYSLLIAAIVAIVAVVGLVIFFKGPSSAGAANVILPQEVPTQAEIMYEEPALIGNKVAIPPAEPDLVKQLESRPNPHVP